MPLHTDYRPRTLDEIAGNKDLVEQLKIHLKKDNPNRSLMFIGPSGCGKTTLAECVAKAVIEEDMINFTALNASDFRGIDTVREVRESASRKPLGKGKTRVWLWDECFYESTLIETPNGPIPIKQIKIGDTVFCIKGVSKVKSVFTNRVALNRVLKLVFTNGKTIYTTVDHEFLTENSWVRAGELKNHFIFGFNSDRSKENPNSNRIGLESTEIYQPGNNDESFFGIIRDQERHQGFVEFYDLEIEDHPSYFAEGIPVHNCHKISPDGQEAMLKLLEDPPPRCWFILATTNPEKLKETLKRRVTVFEVQTLTDRELSTLLFKTCKQTGKKVPTDIINHVIRECNGSPGIALNVLDKVIDLPEEKMKTAVTKFTERASNIIFLGRTLQDLRKKKFPSGSWGKTICPILKELESEDPETIRRQVLDYFRKIFLSGDESAYNVMTCFSKPYYDTGKAGLSMSVYEALCQE